MPTERYGVCEAATILGIDRKTLVKWTAAGLIKCGFRKVNARRFYTGAEILKVWRAEYALA